MNKLLRVKLTICQVLHQFAVDGGAYLSESVLDLLDDYNDVGVYGRAEAQVVVHDIPECSVELLGHGVIGCIGGSYPA